ncbi:MAG: cell division protein FtsL [Proteobacteria bacterium]|nr:cell division protein FtsL [Pseudomonadota bacterium]MDA0852711.1 cell division protein FtsL [Pseudomonadota bacterium]
MRSLLFVFMFAAVIGIAYWAYQENIRTKQELAVAEDLQTAIGAARNRLSILRAEWAYQNRPSRLQDLADLNFENLQLTPLRAEHFSRVDEVGFPAPPKINLSDLEIVEIAQRGENEND